MKHDEYWEINKESKVKEGEGDGEILVKTETFEAEQEVIVHKYKCNYCERSFLSNQGKRIHVGKTHKKEYKNMETTFDCETCQWSGFSEHDLDKHNQVKHIAHLVFLVRP